MKILIVLSILVSVSLVQGAGKNDLESSVIFNLYTRANNKVAKVLKIGDTASLQQSNFNSQKPTYVIVHGWKNSLSSPAIQQPKDALLARYDCNVIGVDWGNIASSILYPSVAGRVPEVGAYVAEFLKFLKTAANLDLKRTHLIGHSLGAHVCGFAGKNLKGLGLARITGLDPAGPGFPAADSAKRLDATDADSVDCIYTNAGKLGISTPICKGNVYPNGGRSQPGCFLDLIGTCSHSRAYGLFSESVSPLNRFKVSKCSSVPNAKGDGCVPTNDLMGEPAPPGWQGIYYVKTGAQSPYALSS